LKREHTGILVRADLSSHQITVERLGKVIMRIRAATGAASTPTPTGLYFVTDRLAFPVGSSYGSFVFGISGIQPRLGNWPHNQLAIHGTNNPASIGTSASAGCLRVSERSLALLKPLLRIGTPVVVQR
jgi:lipoprotein-anchoring transpeptidase ErfK/SrfK